MGLSWSHTPAWSQWAPESLLGSPFVPVFCAKVPRMCACSSISTLKGPRVPTALHRPLGSLLRAAHGHLMAPQRALQLSSHFLLLLPPWLHRTQTGSVPSCGGPSLPGCLDEVSAPQMFATWEPSGNVNILPPGVNRPQFVLHLRQLYFEAGDISLTHNLATRRPS